jgi:hypothetical protein
MDALTPTHSSSAVPPDHKPATDGHASTTITSDGRLAWSVDGDPPDINRIHHLDELLDDGEC